MKPMIILRAGLLTAGAFFLLAALIPALDRQQEIPEKETIVSMRHIGHQLLLRAGDSSSRVPPVKRVNATTFQLTFPRQLPFTTDTLVAIARQSLPVGPAAIPFVVNMRDYRTQETIYGFMMGPKKETTLVPCMGRKQRAGQYMLEVTFLPEKVEALIIPYSFGFVFAGLLVMAFTGSVYLKREKIRPVPENVNLQLIGKYAFDPERKMLKHGQHAIPLSDKETRLLKIFAANLNQPVTREHLMKRVWEDEGVFVGRSLDVFISRLRKKLKDDDSLKLVNIHGTGYRLEVEQPAVLA